MLGTLVVEVFMERHAVIRRQSSSRSHMMGYLQQSAEWTGVERATIFRGLVEKFCPLSGFQEFSSSHNDRDAYCCICMDPMYGKQQAVRELQCGHVYHSRYVRPDQ